MKKWVIALVFAAAVLVAVIILLGISGASDKKHYCATVADCVISERDPDGFATCVNKEWNEEWKGNPGWECLTYGTEECGCIDNKCQRIDSEPGC